MITHEAATAVYSVQMFVNGRKLASRYLVRFRPIIEGLRYMDTGQEYQLLTLVYDVGTTWCAYVQFQCYHSCKSA